MAHHLVQTKVAVSVGADCLEVDKDGDEANTYESKNGKHPVSAVAGVGPNSTRTGRHLVMPSPASTSSRIAVRCTGSTAFTMPI